MPVVPRGRAGGARLPAARQGGRGRRRARDARRALAGRARRGARRPRGARRRRRSATTRVFFERYVERPRHVEIQLLADAHGHGRRARRARVLGPAPPPEGARGVALPRARPGAARAHERGGGRVRAGDRLPQRGTAEFVLDGARVLLPRAERPHPGRASRSPSSSRGARPRRRAAPDRRGRAARGRAAALRGHAVEVRLYAEDPTHVPAAGRHGSSACACPAGSASTPASRRATRSAPPTTR